MPRALASASSEPAKPPSPLAPSTAAVAELLRCLIGAYRDAFRSALTDAVLLANYAQTALVADELCKEVGSLPAKACDWACTLYVFWLETGSG